jgi:hypothetical protein
MVTRKISASIPDWLKPVICAAAARDGISMSAWLTEAAKTMAHRARSCRAVPLRGRSRH